MVAAASTMPVASSHRRDTVHRQHHADHAAVVAHRLLNTVAGVQVCVDTLCDTEIVLSPFDRSCLHDTAIEALQHLTDALRRIVTGLPPV